ncbi:ATP-binding cassette domain-containing protein [Thiohalobacter sp.]|uniref:ATP-binding cassette domain-containing protein n=1 Tax=Thiohalobacter sp. TaxID=2025948 RepID=UPI00261C2AFF|nr:ATP-binding cassette domain-containing protein [Thiohalobacter sp.]
MLRFDHLSLRRGDRLLIRDADLTLFPGQHAGLTGANGSGKSSLFSLILGELSADAGSIELPPDWVIAHVAQETPALDMPARDFVLEGDARFATLRRELDAAEVAGDGPALARLHDRMAGIGGYEAPARAGRLLHGLGFPPDTHERPVSSFSGGWRMRLNLARALMSPSDLLLLDEPTNHLDLDAVLWLEEWLRGYPGLLLLISHDRDFLDRVVDRILHIEQQGLRLYTGNYSGFERQRAAWLAGQAAARKRQQREIAHIENFVRRFRAKASKARQAQSRLKALERLEEIAPAHVDSPFRFSFPGPERLPNPLIRLDGAAAGYDGEPVLRGIDLDIGPEDRIGLLGRNGAGKSTLIRLLTGELAPLAGRRQPAADLRIGYFAQHQLEQLDGEASALAHLQRLDPRAPEQALRDFLGGFGFSGDRALDPVAPFSGGERARLALARVVWQRPNLLLLDEPSNHLDLDMRLALELALNDFGGALVLVSHDRHLLRTCTERLLLVEDGRVTRFDGDLDDYRQRLAQGRETAATHAPAAPHSAGNRRDRRRAEAEARQRLAPLRRRLAQAEAELERLENERDALERRLADPALYAEGAGAELTPLLRARGELERRLAEAEERCLALMEALEAARLAE